MNTDAPTAVARVKGTSLTSNQRRAVSLAETIRDGAVEAVGLSDADWHLLLLAGNIRSRQPLLPFVAQRVLDQAGRHVGYFHLAPGHPRL